MSIKTNESAKERLSTNEKFKIDKKFKPILLVAGLVAATGLISIPVSLANHNYVDKNAQVVNFYENQKYLGDDHQVFYRDMKSYDKEFEKLSLYIEYSYKLHDLKLDQVEDITYFTDTVDFVEPQYMDALIEDYENSIRTLINKSNKTVGDEVVEFNHKIYVLKELEKMYNERVYNGYRNLEQYGIASTKSYLSDIYGGKPEEYSIYFNDYHHDGFKEIEGPGIHYGDAIDSDIYHYLDAVAAVYKADNAKEPEPDKFNADRNKALLRAISEYNSYGSKIIKDIEKQNKTR